MRREALECGDSSPLSFAPRSRPTTERFATDSRCGNECGERLWSAVTRHRFLLPRVAGRPPSDLRRTARCGNECGEWLWSAVTRHRFLLPRVAGRPPSDLRRTAAARKKAATSRRTPKKRKPGQVHLMRQTGRCGMRAICATGWGRSAATTARSSHKRRRQIACERVAYSTPMCLSHG